MPNKEKIKSLLSKIKKTGRYTLLENEIYEILKLSGINTPLHTFVPFGKSASSVLKEAGNEVVVKVVSAEIFHKTEAGGVVFCKNSLAEINGSIKEITKSTSKYNVHGFLVEERVPHSDSFGNELILSVRNSPDFGTVTGFGIGGLDTEFFGKRMQGAFTLISGDRKDITIDLLKDNAAYYKIAGLDRAGKRLCSDDDILDLIKKITELGRNFSEGSGSGIVITELELNPVIINKKAPVAVDALMKFADESVPALERPLKKLENLFHPKSIAILGVSQKNMNMGRIILNNIINKNFDKSKIWIIKPGTSMIDGVSCVPSIKDLPQAVDLLVVALSAEETPSIIKEAADNRLAESLIIIPGGFAEKDGGAELEKEIVRSLGSSRGLPGQGPLVVGGNCLGVISNPGMYDTFFIPKGKIEYSSPYPYAFISQSGAFIISKISKTGFTPQYAVSIGNQLDLTFSDYLSYFKEIKGINLIAGYIEGFKKLDGIKTVRIIRELKEKGKDVLIYKGGRTGEGKNAAGTHTASIAGDFVLYKKMMEDAGALVAESFIEFEALLTMALRFSGLKKFGLRLSIMSNAGFETVGMADNIRNAKLADISKKTKDGITRLLENEKIDRLVNIKNPLDITPVAGDDTYVGCAELLLNDENTDAVIVSCIPMTGAIKSVGSELDATSMFNRLNGIWKKAQKPFVLVVDCGGLYAPACSLIKDIPVLTEADRAISSLIKYLSYKGGKK